MKVNLENKIKILGLKDPPAMQYHFILMSGVMLV